MSTQAEYARHMSDQLPITSPNDPNSSKLPRWVWKAIIVFWLGFLGTILIRYAYDRLFSFLILLLVSLFLSLAIEPGTTKLAKRGWRRGRATIVILLGLMVGVLNCVQSSPMLVPSCL